MAMALSVSGFPSSSVSTGDTNNTDIDPSTSSQDAPGRPQLASNPSLNGPSRSLQPFDAPHSPPIPPPPPLTSPSNNLRSHQSEWLFDSAPLNRPRGQSAAARPSLRLHIANPTADQPISSYGGINQPTLITKNNSKRDNAILQAQLASDQDQQIPPMLDLYPTSVINTGLSMGGTIVNTNFRGRGETFSNFTFGADSAGDGSPSPPHIRITTTNLNMSALTASTQQATHTPSNSSTPSSGSASASAPSGTRLTAGGGRTQPTMTPMSNAPRFPTVTSPANQASAISSSASTTTTSIFTDDHNSASALSCASTPASLESGNVFTSTTRSRGRPLPVPPPPSLPPLSAIPPPPPSGTGSSSRASSGTRSRKTSASGPGAQQPQLVFDPASSTWVIKPSGPRASSKLGPQGQGYTTQTHGAPAGTGAGSGLTHASSTHGYTHHRSQSDQLREMKASTPPPLPPPPTSAVGAGNEMYRYGAKWKGKQPMRGDSTSSGTEGIDDPDSTVSRSEKWKGKQPMRGEPEDDTSITSPSPEPAIPYRSEKWKGKQPMRGDYVAQDSSNEEEYASPVTSPVPAPYGSAKWKGKQPIRGGEIAPDSSSEDYSVPPSSSPLPEPPSASYGSAKWKGKQPIRGDTAPSSSNEELGLPPSFTSRSSSGADRGGISKWKGKARDIIRTSSISSVSSVDKDSASPVISKWKGKGKEVIRKSGSFSSVPASAVGYHNNNSGYSNYSSYTAGGGYSSVSTPLANLQSASATSFSSSPTSSPIVPPPPPPPSAAPHLPTAPTTPASANIAHPNALVPGLNKSSSSGVSSSGLRSSGIWTTMPIPVEPLNVVNKTTPSVPPSSPTVASPLPPVPEKDPWYAATKRQEYTPMHTHPSEADSDEEGRALYREVEAMYSPMEELNKMNGVSGRTTREGRKNVDTSVDLGYGYAEEGYEDDERVYVDDGYDDPNDVGELDMEFGVSASGQLVGAGAGAYVDMMKGGSGEFAASRPSLASQRRKSPSPIRYARRRRDSLFEDDFDDEDSPVAAKNLVSVSPAPHTTEAVGDGNTAPLDGSFVYVTESGTLSPRSPTGRGRGRSRGRGVSGRQSNRTSIFDPADILGDETEMVFASNISPTRQHSPRGAFVTGTEDRVYVRGKWRLRSPSPNVISTSPVHGEGGVVVKGRGGPGLSGLRRYASEESLIMVGPPEDNAVNGAHTLGREFAPVRPRGFEEFNLTPNRYIPPPPELELKSKKSNHGHNNGSLRSQTPVHGPASRPAGGGYDYMDGLQWGAAAEMGRQGRDAKRSNTSAKKSKHRGLSVPREGNVRDAQPGNNTLPMSTFRKDTPGRVSYDIWVEKGLEPPKPKKSGVRI